MYGSGARMYDWISVTPSTESSNSPPRTYVSSASAVWNRRTPSPLPARLCLVMNGPSICRAAATRCSCGCRTRPRAARNRSRAALRSKTTPRTAPRAPRAPRAAARSTPRSRESHRSLPWRGPLGGSAAGDVGGDGEPAALAARPDVRVSARSRSAVRQRVRRPRMDDRDVADEPHADVVRLVTRDRDRARRLGQESRPIDERAVRVAAQEVLREDFVEPVDVRGLDGPDVVPIELLQAIDIRMGTGLGWHGSHLRR